MVPYEPLHDRLGSGVQAVNRHLSEFEAAMRAPDDKGPTSPSGTSLQ